MLKINYRNPLTKAFQAEYALYMLASDLFAGVNCKSLLPDRLKLYYTELPLEKQYTLENTVQSLIDRDVINHITFPGMHLCRADLLIMPEKNGTHTFLFTDGIYGFSLRLKFGAKGNCSGIAVEDLCKTTIGPDKASGRLHTCRMCKKKEPAA